MASPTKAFFAGENGAVPAGWTPTISAPEPDTWQNVRHGGGYGYGQITHIAGLLFWSTELRAARAACVMTAPKSKVDMYDSAIVEFTNSATGNISGAATLPDGHPFQLQLQIFGDAGVLSLDAEAGRERVIFSGHDRKDKVIPVACGEGAYSCVEPIHNFIDLIQGSGRNCSPGHVAARAVELIDAMYQSARNGGSFANVTLQTTSIHL
jgi:predicted dehydrogenase